MSSRGRSQRVSKIFRAPIWFGNFLPAGPALFAEMSRTRSALVRSFQCINSKLLQKRIIRCFHINDVCTSHCLNFIAHPPPNPLGLDLNLFTVASAMFRPIVGLRGRRVRDTN